MKKDCCIVIITHKEKLDGLEEKSFKRALEVFGCKYDIRLVIPNKSNVSYYNRFNKLIDITRLDDKWFESVKTYSHLLCTEGFYSIFSEYEYILIYQTDCWVYNDRLEYFMSLGYDYYGAPWPLEAEKWGRNKVGNGGLSLRRVSAMKNVCSKHEFNYNKGEDLWFCVVHADEINICDLSTACNFSIEVLNETFKKEIKSFPMGLHGKAMMKYWDDFEFWLK